MKNFIYSLITTISFALGSINAQVQKGNDIDGLNIGEQSGHSISMPNNNTIAIGAPAVGHGLARVYVWNGTGWAQKGTDIIGEYNEDAFGYSIFMPDSITLAVSAPYNDGNGNMSGHVRIFSWSGGSWVQRGADIDGEASMDRSGISMCMPNSNTIAIGAAQNDGNGSDAGHVRIYYWTGLAWTQKGTDVNGFNAYDQSGFSVSMADVNTVAIGSPTNNDNGNLSGHTRIFDWNGTNWTQRGNAINGETSLDLSGQSVNMANTNVVAIGAHQNSGGGAGGGHVRVFNWDGLTWVQMGQDIDGSIGSSIGRPCSFSMPNQSTIAVGFNLNSNNGNNKGQIKIYNLIGAAWLESPLSIYGESNNDQFGFTVCMPDPNTIAGGSIFNDDGGLDAGQVRVFSFNTISIEEVKVFENDGIKICHFNNILNIELPYELIGKNIKITNSFGTVISDEKITHNHFTLNTSFLPSGVFNIKINDYFSSSFVLIH
jgi:hypothetical protein